MLIPEYLGVKLWALPLHSKKIGGSVSCQLTASFQISGCISAEQGPTSFILAPIHGTMKCHLYNLKKRMAWFEVRVETVDAVIDQLSSPPIPIIGDLYTSVSADYGSLCLSFGKPPQAKVDISLKIRKAWLSIANLELQLGTVSKLFAYTQPQFSSAT